MDYALSPARTSALQRSAAERTRPAGSPAQRAAVSPTRPAAAGLAQLAAIVNPTGLPDALKAGVEALSGQSLDHVRVHRNSAKPAQLNAHAYAQGSDIHVAPGQEKHLPHEAWHVVQQAQGRVKPTTQLQAAGTPINDDPGLEREADRMGQQAAQMKIAPEAAPAPPPASAPPPAAAIQRVPWNAVIAGRDQALENAQNARLGAGVVPLHPIAIGAQPDPVAPAQTLGAQRHFDADMREQVAKILNYLPASHIVGNPALTRVVMERATPANPGMSYFGGGQLHIVVPYNASSWVYMSMSKWPVGELATTPMTNIGYTRTRTPAGARM